MAQKYLIVTKNDSPSTTTMGLYPTNATQVVSDAATISWVWVSQTATDTNNMENLFAHAGQSGYPIGGVLLSS